MDLDQFHTVVRREGAYHLSATIQVVLEPLKTRIISKGESLAYYWMKPLQIALHSALRKIPCFRLIGRTLSPTDLMDLVSRPLEQEAEGTDNMQWHSVDYSAATDGLSSRLGLAILERVLEWEMNGPISGEVKLAAMRVLGPHQLYYPTRGKDGKPKQAEFKGLQRNGQLMGSILSFPILCLANAMVYADVVGAKSLEDFNHVLINGDDMLYRGTEVEWDKHVVVGKSVGLEMSVGKAYRHPVYANINSTGFHHKVCGVSSTPWQIDFLNLGLVFGQHKVQNKEEVAASHHDDSGSFAANVDVILNGCLPGKQKQILALAISLNEDKLKQESQAGCRIATKCGRYRTGSFMRNLFLPAYAGGLGATAPIGWQVRVTPVQRKVAYGCLAAMPYYLHAAPLPAFELSDIVLSREPWLGKPLSRDPPLFPIGDKRLRLIPFGLLGGCDECRSARRS